MSADIEAAMARGSRIWHRALSHVDCEGAYLDRTLLAAEINRLRDELAETLDALTEAENEIDDIPYRD